MSQPPSVLPACSRPLRGPFVSRGLGVAIASVLAVGSVFGSAIDADPPAPPSSDSLAANAAGVPSAFVDAAELLDALERAGDRVDTLRANINHVKVYAIQGDVQVRSGVIVIKNERDLQRSGVLATAPVRRLIRLDFDRRIVDSRVRDERVIYLFDGEWLAEIQPDEKQFVRRQVAAPGEVYDPLQLGEGPVPIPFGQRASEVAASYEASLAEVNEGLTEADDETIGLEPMHLEALQRTAAGTVQLVLVPRPGTESADRFVRARVWYDRDTLLPRMTMTLGLEGDLDVVQLTEMVTGDPVASGAMSTIAPPTDIGWTVRIEPYRGESRAAGGEPGPSGDAP